MKSEIKDRLASLTGKCPNCNRTLNWGLWLISCPDSRCGYARPVNKDTQ